MYTTITTSKTTSKATRLVVTMVFYTKIFLLLSVTQAVTWEVKSKRKGELPPPGELAYLKPTRQPFSFSCLSPAHYFAYSGTILAGKQLYSFPLEKSTAKSFLKRLVLYFLPKGKKNPPKVISQYFSNIWLLHIEFHPPSGGAAASPLLISDVFLNRVVCECGYPAAERGKEGFWHLVMATIYSTNYWNYSRSSKRQLKSLESHPPSTKPRMNWTVFSRKHVVKPFKTERREKGQLENSRFLWLPSLSSCSVFTNSF